MLHSLTFHIDITKTKKDLMSAVSALKAGGFDSAMMGTKDADKITMYYRFEAPSLQSAIETVISKLNTALPRARITKVNVDLPVDIKSYKL